MAVLSNTGIRAGASGVAADPVPYTVKRSARFNNADSSYLNWTPTAAGNRKTWTWSGWVKRSGFGTRCGFFATQNTKDYFEFWGDSNEEMALTLGNTNSHRLETSGLFRDPSAWYHIVIALDTTQATASNRWKLYVNGSQVTDFDTANYPSQNYQCEEINNTNAHHIGADYSLAANKYFNGLITDVHFIDGTAKAATDFAETDSTTGQWVPKEYTGSYGTNGYHLAIDPANGGTDYSNSTTVSSGGFNSSYPASNLFDGRAPSDDNRVEAASNDIAIDITFSPAITVSSQISIWSGKGSVRYQINNSGSYTTYSNSSEYENISHSGSLTNLKILHGSAGEKAGLSAIKIDGKQLNDHTAIGYDSSGNKNHWHENNIFGHEATVANENFKAVTYTGTGGAQTIACGFQPDAVWVKARSATYNHAITDAVRGVTKRLYPNLPNVEDTQNPASGVTAFTTNGFTLGTAADYNEDGVDFVAWAWKAGGSASSNTDGSITSSVSANTTAGFSVVSFEGTGANATVGHGLGKVPGLIIVKDRDSGSNWWSVYHQNMGNTKAGFLNSNQLPPTSTFWNDTSPTSTVFTIGTNANTNTDDNDIIAYCWAETAGHSKFGSFEGAATVTVDCGFTPAFILIKDLDAAGSWSIFDNARDSDNEINHRIYANEAGAQGTDTVIGNFTANGFNLTNQGNTNWNKTGDTFIYAAFAGNPAGDLDLLADTPGAPYDNELNGGGNYATMNALDIGSNVTLSDGNLKVYIPSSNHCAKGNFGMNSGKWYWEVNITQDGNNTHGIAPTDFGNTNWCGVGDSLAYNGTNGKKYTGSTAITYGSNVTHGTGDIIGTAFDADSGSLTFYKNGVSLGVAWSDVDMTKTWVACCGQGSSTHTYNFGQRTFAYTPPSGFKALNTYNLSDPTIVKGNTGFDVKTYSGDDDVDRAFTGYNMSPDFVWTKDRGATYHHILCDAVRGSAKKLASNLDDAENDGTTLNTSYGYVDTFDANGYTLGGGTAQVNASGQNYVSWAWDAGTANVSKAAGSLNSALYDQSYTWSDTFASAGSWWSGYDNTKAFDGNSGTESGTNASSVACTFTIPVGYRGTNRVWMVKVRDNDQISVDGSVVRTEDAGRGSADNWYTLASTNPTSIAIYSTTSSSNLKGVKADGKELVDNGVTMANVPTIASTYRANPNTGFSVVTFTDASSSGLQSIAHGLNDTPALILLKDRDASADWSVMHKSIPNDALYLNKIDDKFDSSRWDKTPGTSNVFYWNDNSTNSHDLVAYVWSEVSGYSKFGSYTGNNVVNGPFVWCGFKPALIIIKCHTDDENWMMYDTTRDTDNLIFNNLYPNLSNAENSTATDNEIDILSNGFKLRNEDGGTNNASGYIFAAFAESPFKYANAR